MKKVGIIAVLVLLFVSFEGKALSFKRQVLPVAVLITLPVLDGFCRVYSKIDEELEEYKHVSDKLVAITMGQNMLSGAIYGTMFSILYLKLESLHRK